MRNTDFTSYLQHAAVVRPALCVKNRKCLLLKYCKWPSWEYKMTFKLKQQKKKERGNEM